MIARHFGIGKRREVEQLEIRWQRPCGNFEGHQAQPVDFVKEGEHRRAVPFEPTRSLSPRSEES